MIPIYTERSIDNDLVDEGQQNLIDYFQKKGYFHVTVKINLKRHPDEVVLVYEIERGKKEDLKTLRSLRGSSIRNLSSTLPSKSRKVRRRWSETLKSQATNMFPTTN